MKMYWDKKIGIQKMILFSEILKRFDSETFIWVCKLLNETKKMRKF